MTLTIDLTPSEEQDADRRTQEISGKLDQMLALLRSLPCRDDEENKDTIQ